MVSSAEATRTSYPRIPASNWWELRRRFRQSPPKEVSLSYLQTVLGIGEGAAKNLLPSLKATGLVDDAGKLTERAMRWREDDQYAAVCAEIRDQVYPDGLRDALPPPDPDRAQVERRFARETGTGQAAANKMASFYILLAEGDVEAAQKGQDATTPKPRGGKGGGSRSARADVPRPLRAREAAPAARRRERSVDVTAEQPSLHLTVQIHIDSGASLEQIDQMFASLAKHLYRREAE